jgi:septal ring factor EnvC (AmiA/AmiB activator)
MSHARTQEESLSGVVKIVIVVMVVCLGLWGCARKPSSGGATSGDRLRALESRCQKLEQDYRQVAGARDQARAELARLQKEVEERAALLRERDGQVKASQAAREEAQKLLTQRTSERDDLRQQVANRVTECDALIGRCEKFRKGLQQLLGEDQTPTSAPAPVSPAPSAVSSAASLGGQS